MAKLSCIRFGDQIRLTLADGRVMCAEGALNDSCFIVKPDIPRMERTIFRVCTKHQYSAMNEFNHFLKVAPSDESAEWDQKLRYLDHGRTSEEAYNASTMRVRKAFKPNVGAC